MAKYICNGAKEEAKRIYEGSINLFGVLFTNMKEAQEFCYSQLINYTPDEAIKIRGCLDELWKPVILNF